MIEFSIKGAQLYQKPRSTQRLVPSVLNNQFGSDGGARGAPSIILCVHAFFAMFFVSLYRKTHIAGKNGEACVCPFYVIFVRNWFGCHCTTFCSCSKTS